MGNRLTSNYFRRAVMAEWVTHLTTDLGYLVRVSSPLTFKIPPLDVNVCLGIFLLLFAVKRLRIRE